MFGKNIFRTFLYLVVAIVLLKLCYNLGYSFVNRRVAPATKATPSKTDTSLTPAEADSTSTSPQ